MKYILIFTTAIIFLLLKNEINAQTCDENLIYEIDRIKQETETMLVDANEVKITLETGETLMAFYINGELAKISVWCEDPYLSAEIYFKNGFTKHISEDLLTRIICKDFYYFKDGKLICYSNERTGDYNDLRIYKRAEKTWLERIERYLLAVQ